VTSKIQQHLDRVLVSELTFLADYSENDVIAVVADEAADTVAASASRRTARVVVIDVKAAA
jgi:hypothetical protein